VSEAVPLESLLPDPLSSSPVVVSDPVVALVPALESEEVALEPPAVMLGPVAEAVGPSVPLEVDVSVSPSSPLSLPPPSHAAVEMLRQIAATPQVVFHPTKATYGR